MANIRIDIASEFKDKGFKKAEKSAINLDKSFKKLGRTATRTFVAVAGIRALKQSVIAFAEEEKAAIKLATSLRNLGLAYNTRAIEDYLEKTEKATGVNKDQLSPAIAQLITKTLDADKSIKMLNIAMDISASTGRDLGSVTMALSRAYSGNFAALGKIQTAYTAAELKALGFNDALDALAKNYSGAAQRNAETYSGKIDKLSIAFGDVKEEIGKGVLSFLESLGNGDFDNGLQKLVNFGSMIGDGFRRAGVSFEYFKTLLSTGLRIDPEEARKLAELRAAFDNPQAAANRKANSPAANRGFLRDYKQQQLLQKKILEDRKKADALAKKAENDRKKRERDAAALKRAGTVFDMENIQIVAAMQGKIDGEQRLRLVALLAIHNEMADAAEKTAKAVLNLNAPALANLGVIVKSGESVTTVINNLAVAQAKTALVALGIKDLPKASNPFEDWFDIIDRVLLQLAKVKAAVASVSSPTAPTITSNTPAATVTATVPPNVATALAAPSVLAASVTDLSAMRQDTGVSSALGIKLKEQIDEYTTILKSTFGTGAVVDELTKREAMANQVNVTVNVQGSVIAEQDLADTITNQLYDYQRAGKGLLLSSTAI